MEAKLKDFFLDVNKVGEKVSLEPISLSKLATIEKAYFNDYIIKKQGD